MSKRIGVGRTRQHRVSLHRPASVRLRAAYLVMFDPAARLGDSRERAEKIAFGGGRAPLLTADARSGRSGRKRERTSDAPGDLDWIPAANGRGRPSGARSDPRRTRRRSERCSSSSGNAPRRRCCS